MYNMCVLLKVENFIILGQSWSMFVESALYLEFDPEHELAKSKQ